MGYFKGWMTTSERKSKKDYIAISRRIVKRLITNNLVERIPNMVLDHLLSLEHAWYIHLDIIIVNSPINLKNISKEDNSRKGSRSYLSAQSLINLYNTSDNKDYLKLISELEDKWEVSFGTYSEIIRV
jgi:hypothetical protein